MSTRPAIEQFRQASSFDNLRKTLSNSRYADDREKALAYWVLPTDRRLPQAFLGRTLGDVLNTPFEQLAATPGVGHKKIGALLKLLLRVAQRRPSAPDPALVESEPSKHLTQKQKRNAFDPRAVSEEVWRQWATALRATGVEHEKLGRLAPTLLPLPLAIWQTPLHWYLDRTLAEIRQLKTHGEKRVNVILEVVNGVYRIVSQMPSQGHLAIRLMPSFVAKLENWIRQRAADPQEASANEVREALLIPLVKQIAVDCGSTVARVVESRLPIGSEPVSVHVVSRRLGLTRARIYQLAEEAENAMRLRWPEGKEVLLEFFRELRAAGAQQKAVEAVRLAVALLFPDESERAHREFRNVPAGLVRLARQSEAALLMKR